MEIIYMYLDEWIYKAGHWFGKRWAMWITGRWAGHHDALEVKDTTDVD